MHLTSSMRHPNSFPLKIQKKSCKKLVINQENGYKVGSKARKKLSPK